jgi:hypothetical protein
MGESNITVGKIRPETLVYRVEYPEDFPATYPAAYVVSPALPPEEVGHKWHRWPIGGAVCYVEPKDWQTGITADDVIAKLEDWYFNYVAVKSGLIATMPDLGRANLPQDSEDNA